MAASKAPLVRLHHIADEIMNLSAALKGANFQSFSESYILLRTTEHAILIISEAVKTLPAHLTDQHATIDWRAIRDIGNILRHSYFEVDRQVLWRIASERLPELKVVIDEMIQTHSA